MGWAISSAILKSFKAALASLSNFAMPLIVRCSCAIWFGELDRITASCRRSRVSLTEISGFDIWVPRVFLDHRASRIQFHWSSANICFHLHDFSQQDKVHITPIFFGARVNWCQIRGSLALRDSTPAGGSVASSMTPTNPATAEVALFFSDRFLTENLYRSRDLETVLERYFSSDTIVKSLYSWA